MNKKTISSMEEIERYKVWLFKESIRIQNEKRELDFKINQFDKEKRQFLIEMKQINKRIQSEQKKQKQEHQMIQKKLDILKNAYTQLYRDQEAWNNEKTAKEKYAKKKSFRWSDRESYDMTIVEKGYFTGVHNILTLKKRYKDLMKIFHPDNMCGDSDTVKVIHQQYKDLRKRFYEDI